MPQKKKDTSKQSEFVTKEYFDDKFSQLVDIVGKLAETKQAPESVKSGDGDAEKEVGPSEAVTNPAWRELVNESLGKDFGMMVTYPKSGASFNFKVLVPRSKSNASPAHWDYYKCDMRTKAIGNNEGVEGIKQFLTKVRRNLGMDKKQV